MHTVNGVSAGVRNNLPQHDIVLSQQHSQSFSSLAEESSLQSLTSISDSSPQTDHNGSPLGKEDRGSEEEGGGSSGGGGGQRENDEANDSDSDTDDDNDTDALSPEEQKGMFTLSASDSRL
jgi:hypothetical protein